MSSKFKSGDMVEIFDKNGRTFYGSFYGCYPGMIGTIVRYYGDTICGISEGIISRAWLLNLPDGKPVWVAEDCLKLIPGNQDCKETGEWDLCPWNPYKQKQGVIHGM